MTSPAPWTTTAMAKSRRMSWGRQRGQGSPSPLREVPKRADLAAFLRGELWLGGHQGEPDPDPGAAVAGHGHEGVEACEGLKLVGAPLARASAQKTPQHFVG